MDLLNKLKDNIDGEPAEQQSAPKAHHTTSDGKDNAAINDPPSLLDKLTLGSHRHREERLRELSAREADLHQQLDALAKEKAANSGFFHTLHQKLDKDAAAEGSAEAAELEKRETKLKAELEAVEKEKRDVEDGVLGLGRLKDKLDFDGDDDDGKGQKRKGEGGEGEGGEHAGVGGFLDKITGKAAEEERLRREEENKGALEKMKDRINEGMGGGRKAEKEEDLLDKTIDGFQKHVLKQGEQDNESALEQMKDEKIADMLRKQLNLKEEEEVRK